MIIRPAEPTDATSGAHCHLACWREAYVDLVEPERLAALTADLAGSLRLWRRVTSGDQAPLIAVENEAVVGFIAAGPAQEPGVDADFWLRVLNVRRKYWGTGVAQRLYDAAVGNRSAYLWVLRDNARARAFYARNGFVPDGAAKIDPDFAAPIIRMVRATAGSGSGSSGSRHGC